MTRAEFVCAAALAAGCASSPAPLSSPKPLSLAPLSSPEPLSPAPLSSPEPLSPAPLSSPASSSPGPTLASAPSPPAAPATAAGPAAVAEAGEVAKLGALVASARARCHLLAPAAERAAGYAAAVQAHRLAPRDRAAALALARCAHLQADLENDPRRVTALAEQGATAAHEAAAGPDDAEAAYLQALNLGLYVRDQGLSALGRLAELVALLEAAGHAPELDEGGPLRVLGLLYLRAPAWPVGPGDLDRALRLLERAAATYSEHPLNHAYHAEALLEDRRHAAARAALEMARRKCTPERFGDWAAPWQAEIDRLSRRAR
jgi:hypothetical protein